MIAILGVQFVISWNAAKTNQYPNSHASIFRFTGSLSKDDPTLNVQRGLSRKTWRLSLWVSAKCFHRAPSARREYAYPIPGAVSVALSNSHSESLPGESISPLARPQKNPRSIAEIFPQDRV